MKSLNNLNIMNTMIKTLKIDPIKENYVRKVQTSYSLVNPTPVINPKLICYSKNALELLDLDLNEIKNPEFPLYFSGNKLLPTSTPYAHCYSGYQFGVFAGQLGDGRAHCLGEIVNNKNMRYELQLKGSGKTPFSRNADGRAVLRSSIREFLCSEAMHYLGIPTTRSASIITSDTFVERDIKYNGEITDERATVISRIAPTFIRFGSFHIINSNTENIKELLYYVIKYHYTNIFNKSISFEQQVIMFAQKLSLKTANLVALWQAFGFVHGVLNTDNMSIVGLTIDFGPFAFMDDFNPNHVSNTSDTQQRYKFKNQPAICKWNLEKLFESLVSMYPNIKTSLDEILENFMNEYRKVYMEKLKMKFGFTKILEEDENIINLFFDTLHITSADYTNVFRCLSQFQVLKNIEINKHPTLDYILNQTRGDIKTKICPIKNRDLWITWLTLYRSRINKEDIDIQTRINIMNNNNPKYILRNHLVQHAIRKANISDYSEIMILLDVLKDPFDKLRKYDNLEYDQMPEVNAAKIMNSCSS